ncbi:glycoside hydrolase family 16 protein [Neobacillus sp. PS3-34]|uniref:glycoside hydrolase family 16 protein n=1 Tax=Neobacillus sp. PS3-34 TaxID=3070678 RepID=UPI0027E146CC|nr:glycoside hydrolase family 16 protein [Neobacillus sp. PS3-34]WML49062.1 glycoside hydrolase family 16 protein [Neobacillus sp. PS3-34]
MKLIFCDEFDYEGAPNSEKWVHDIGGHGFGNNESQYYTDRLKNSFVKDGKLHIVGFKEDFEENHYTSAKLLTYGTFSMKYGRVDVSAKLPKGKGSWPAIWMLPNSIMEGKDWPLCGEIDIMEHVGKEENMVHVSLHTESYNHAINTQRTHFEPLDNVTSTFHKYSCEWTPDYIKFFYDDREVASFNKQDYEDTSETGWPFDQEFFLILNVAIGGFWGGEIDETMLPYEMEVDYVRVYEL